LFYSSIKYLIETENCEDSKFLKIMVTKIKIVFKYTKIKILVLKLKENIHKCFILETTSVYMSNTILLKPLCITRKENH